MSHREQRLTTAIVVGLLALGSAVLSHIPAPDDLARRPFVTVGTLGSSLRLRTGQIQVERVPASTTVRQGAITAATSAHWLVVTMTFTADREPAALAGMTIRAVDGRTYSLTRPFRSSCGVGQPGITIRCALPFELPRDAVAGAVLVVPAELLGGGEGDDVAEIDLRITAETAAELTAVTEVLSVDAVTVVGAQVRP